jgi:phosphoenolpyruvate carboxykinase (ATP)
VFACADPRYRLRVRIVTELAWHSLFAHNLFIRPAPDQRRGVARPRFHRDVAALRHCGSRQDGTRSETFILVNFERCMVIIGGTRYAGEIKKSIFTALNT